MPETIEDFISAENPVRFLDAFVDNLDLKELGFPLVVPEAHFRPPQHPGVLIRLYLHGYINAFRSSRALEREANRNFEVIWLLKQLAPDHKTIADFRNLNGTAIHQLCREFVNFCKYSDLFGGELVAVDGSKFKASNTRDRDFSQAKLEDRLKETDEKIDRYLRELDENDKKESGFRKKSAKGLQEIIAHLKKRKKHLRHLKKHVQNTGKKQVSLTDPDARSMPVGRGQLTEVGYNVQNAVDSKHKLIFNHEVTNDVTDQGHLSSMGKRAKEILGIKRARITTPLPCGYAYIVAQNAPRNDRLNL